MRVDNFFRKYISTRAAAETETKLRDEGYWPISQTSDEDVFLIGFPKSGHTWMQYILTSLVFGVSPKYLRDSLVQELIPDMHIRNYYKRYHDRVFIKSHNLPHESYKNVIYLVRDGRDAMVSYNEMLKKVTKDKVSLEEMIKYDKGVFPCPWREHIRSWLINNPFKINLLVVRYEDLLIDPLTELKRLLQYLKIERDTEFCEEIIANTTVEILREKAKRFGLVHKALNNPDGHKFFRQGKSKVYLSEMDPELVRIFEEKSCNELKYLNY